MPRKASQEPKPDPTLLEHIHSRLYSTVGEAVAPIHNLERTWSQNEMTRRIVRYIYKAASKEDVMKEGPWDQCVDKFVSDAMSGYSSACQERAWFFEIELVDALVAAVWELLRRSHKAPRDFHQVQEVVQLAYEDKLDRILTTKGMWDATRKTFKDEQAISKIYNALYKTFDAALDDAVADTRPIPDLQRMQNFVKRWMNDSMQRAWNSVQGSERALTESSVTKLFGNLVAPFGEDHPYSCIPSIFFPNGDRPDKHWPYIRQQARLMFDQWAREQSAPSAKRRKSGKRKTAADDDLVPPAANGRPDMEVEDVVVEDEGFCSESEPEDYARAGGPPGDHGGSHPECTSEEDCIGCPADRLIRHIMANGPGDVYCQPCWISFLEQNTKLEGEYLDNGKPV